MFRQTIFGPEKIKKVCNTCGKEKDIEEFYSKPYYTDSDTVRRKQCKSCWNKHNGRSNFANVAMFEVK